jgi:hypothetical protein
LHDVIHGRDTRDRIENRREEREPLKQEQREGRDYDYYGPIMINLTDSVLPKGGIMKEESRLFPMT